MSTSDILGLVGAGIGFVVGGPAGAAIGYSIGSGLGNIIDPQQIKQEQESLNGIKNFNTGEGNTIPFIVGSNRAGGVIVWASDMREIRHKKTKRVGGIFGSKVTTVTKTYEIDALIELADNEASGLGRVWWNGEIVANFRPDADTPPEWSSAENDNWKRLTFYGGASDQLPDPTYEAAVGVGNAPAYRGRTTIFIESLQLGYSDQLPMLQFEIFTSAEVQENSFTGGLSFRFATFVDENTIFIDDYHQNDPVIAPSKAYYYNLINGQFTYVPELGYSNNYGDSSVFWFKHSNGKVYKIRPVGQILGVFNHAIDIIDIQNKTVFTVNHALDMSPNQYQSCEGYNGEIWILCSSAKTTLGVAPYDYKWVGRFDQNGNFLGYLRFHLGSPSAPGVTAGFYFDKNYNRLYFNFGAGFLYSTFNTLTNDFDSTVVAGSISTSTLSINGGVIRAGIYLYVIGSSGFNRNIAKIDISDPDNIVVTDSIIFSSHETSVKSYPRSRPLQLWENVWIFTYEAPTESVQVIRKGTALIFYGNETRWTTPVDYGTGDITADQADFVNFYGRYVEEPITLIPLWYPPLIQTASGIKEYHTIGYIPWEIPIDYVVTQIMLRSGYQLTDFDVTDLADVSVDTRNVYGCFQATVASSRDLLDRLMAAYYFDSYLDGEKIVFVRRGQGIVKTIQYLDLVEGSDFKINVNPDLEIPAKAVITAQNYNQNYEPVTVSQDRLVTSTTNTVNNVTLPLVLTATDCAGIAKTIAADGYVARATTEIKLLGFHADLNPTDVINFINYDGSTYRLRIVRVIDDFPTMTLSLVADDPSVLSYFGSTTDEVASIAVRYYEPTRLELLDIPIIRDSDDNMGFYAAICRDGDGTGKYAGAVVYESDTTSNFAPALPFEDATIIGTCQNTLGNFTLGRIFDNDNKLTVVVKGGTLQTSTRSAVLNNKYENLALVGSEVIQFVTATLISAGTYELSGLLRGCRGTEWAIGGHGADERFVMLFDDGVQRTDMESSLLGLTRYYKGVSVGWLESSVLDYQAFANLAVGKKPFAPSFLHGYHDINGDFVIKWIRRTRHGIRAIGALGINVPLAEAYEQYRIEIYDEETLRRTVTVDGITEFNYTYTMQVLDGGALSLINVKIYQISQTVGLGYPLEGIIGYIPAVIDLGWVWMWDWYNESTGAEFVDNGTSISMSINNATRYFRANSHIDNGIFRWSVTINQMDLAEYDDVRLGISRQTSEVVGRNDKFYLKYLGSEKIEELSGQGYYIGDGVAYSLLDVVGFELDFINGWCKYWINGVYQGYLTTYCYDPDTFAQVPLSGNWTPYVEFYRENGAGNLVVTGQFNLVSF